MSVLHSCRRRTDGCEDDKDVRIILQLLAKAPSSVVDDGTTLSLSY
jgi:hypothetical protein